MPIFDFKCANCALEFEELVRGSAKPVCPDCGSSDLDQMMPSNFGIKFRGPGFHNTDYPRPGLGKNKVIPKVKEKAKRKNQKAS